MRTSCIFGAVLALAATLASIVAAGDGESWQVAWFDTVANKAVKYDAVDRADAELFIRTQLQGVNLATGGPACKDIRLLKTRDGATKPVDTFAADVKAAADRINNPINPTQAADKLKTLKKQGWLKALARSERKLSDTLRELGQKLKTEVKDARDVRRTVKEDGAEIGEKELERINDVMANYNRLASEVRAGPLSTAVGDLQPLKTLDGSANKVSARLVRERLLTVETKLEEIALRLEQRELVEAREQLRAEIERIGRDKEAGIDVRRDEQDLEAAVNAWKARRDHLQRKIEIHSAAVAEVFTARQALQDQPEKNSQAPPPESK
jgi:hypothetical protein